MKRTLLLGLACAAMLQTRHVNTIRWVEGVETLGPDKDGYAKRPKKGKGERKANRANRWG